MQVDEFNQSIDLSNFNVVCGVVFVIWKWAWVGDEVDSDNDTSESSLESSLTVIPETPNESLDEPESEPESLLANISSKPLTIHTVTFKCIGCTKEECYRKSLAKASNLMSSGQDVPCVLHPEPQNPVDSRAIAFKLKIDNCWQRIGYVVREVQHTALQNDAILMSPLIESSMYCIGKNQDTLLVSTYPE